MQLRSSKSQPQGVRVDPCQRRDGHRRVAEQEAQHSAAADLVAAQGHVRNEDRAVPLQIPDYDGESLVRPSDGELVRCSMGWKGETCIRFRKVPLTCARRRPSARPARTPSALAMEC